MTRNESHSAQDFIKRINDMRLANKGQWVAYCSTVEGMDVRIKSFNTSIQIFEVGGVNYAGATWDLSVKEFKSQLMQPFND